MSFTVGVDLGGTKVICGAVSKDGEFVAERRDQTPYANVSATVDVITRLVKELAEEYPVESVGIGVAGWINADRTTVFHGPNLGWPEVPLSALLNDKLDLPVVVENDANAAAWAEYRFGAGRGASHPILVTVGTGIGGGIVLNGALYRGAFGTAGEFGHEQAVPGGTPCGCGGHGCLEQYASGSALVRAARAFARGNPTIAPQMLTMANGEPDNIQGTHVTQAAYQGEPGALAAFGEVGRWLGRGLADVSIGWNPDRFVIGGGVAEAGDLFLQPARDSYEAALTEQHCTSMIAPIVPATLGNNAGLVGAADLARHH